MLLQKSINPWTIKLQSKSLKNVVIPFKAPLIPVLIVSPNAPQFVFLKNPLIALATALPKPDQLNVWTNDWAR